MAQLYSYRARGQSGQILDGSIEAGSREDVAKELRDKNLHAVSIKEITDKEKEKRKK